ncbi:MAG: DUF1552 domain-containing protein [Myxococcales bacterium]
MNRRRFLRGLGGVVVGLPLLESLGFRRFVRSQSTPVTRRFVTFFQCNGANMQKFWPADGVGFGDLTDAHFGADRTLYALRGYKQKLLLPRHMNMSPKGFGQDPGTNGCDHQKGMGQKLTAAPLDTSGFATGISLDQFIAKQVNPMGRPALTIGVHNTGGGGTGSISYSGPMQPVTSESNPRLVFQDLMGLGSTPNPQVEDLLTKRRKSVLDLVSEDFATLQAKRLSKNDQMKLDMHFSTIRTLEQEITMPMGPVMGCHPLETSRQQEIATADTGVNIKADEQYPRAGRMQMDLIALALSCDHTRVATLQWGAGAGGPIFKWDGMNHLYNHHKLSHGNTRDDNSGDAVAGYEGMIFDIDKWFAGEFVYLLDKLNAYEEDGGTLLDHSLVMWINELSDGKAHDFTDLPTVLAGSCGGYFKQGKYVELSKGGYADAPHNKLLTSIANAMGAKAAGGGPVTHFGDTKYGEPGEYAQLLA